LPISVAHTTITGFAVGFNDRGPSSPDMLLRIYFPTGWTPDSPEVRQLYDLAGALSGSRAT
jgi:hypothetical protein